MYFSRFALPLQQLNACLLIVAYFLICSTLTQMACLITVCISRKKYESKYINIQKMNQHISISDKLCKSLNVNTYDHFRDITKMVAFDTNLSIKQML